MSHKKIIEIVESKNENFRGGIEKILDLVPNKKLIDAGRELENLIKLENLDEIEKTIRKYEIFVLNDYIGERCKEIVKLRKDLGQIKFHRGERVSEVRKDIFSNIIMIDLLERSRQRFLKINEEVSGKLTDEFFDSMINDVLNGGEIPEEKKL